MWMEMFMSERAPDEHLDIWRECLTRADAVTDRFERLGAWRDIRVAFPAVLDELVAERARYTELLSWISERVALAEWQVRLGKGNVDG